MEPPPGLEPLEPQEEPSRPQSPEEPSPDASAPSTPTGDKGGEAEGPQLEEETPRGEAGEAASSAAEATGAPEWPNYAREQAEAALRSIMENERRGLGEAMLRRRGVLSPSEFLPRLQQGRVLRQAREFEQEAEERGVRQRSRTPPPAGGLSEDDWAAYVDAVHQQWQDENWSEDIESWIGGDHVSMVALPLEEAGLQFTALRSQGG